MTAELKQLRVALVHYWLVTWGGGERVLRALADMFPHADIFTVVATDEIASRFADHSIRTSFLQPLPGSRRWHRHFLPLYPLALEQFDFRGYDLVISSNSGPAHGVLTSGGTCHISYCHSPSRYLWDLYHDYDAGLSGIARMLFRASAHYLRQWDLAAAARVDRFAANSMNVARRIRKTYRREATVVYPPVDLRSAAPVNSIPGDYYLVAGRLVPYKRVDLAIEVCKRLGRKLHVVGDGPQLRRLRSLASGARVEFLGNISDQELAEQYAGCRALLFPGEEDFGMVPVEAQSFGKPVIAYGRGGALETVVAAETDGTVRPYRTTGIIFHEQTVDCMSRALRSFEGSEALFEATTIRANAARFGAARFRDSMARLIRNAVAQPEFADDRGLARAEGVAQLR